MAAKFSIETAPSIRPLFSTNRHCPDSLAACRVFAGVFKVVVAVVLQVRVCTFSQQTWITVHAVATSTAAPRTDDQPPNDTNFRFYHLTSSFPQMEERLQVIHPPCGGASLISYLVLTHRGSVPHYR